MSAGSPFDLIQNSNPNEALGNTRLLSARSVIWLQSGGLPHVSGIASSIRIREINYTLEIKPSVPLQLLAYTAILQSVRV